MVALAALEAVLMELLKAGNLAIRFALELAALAAIGYWGYEAASGTLMRFVLMLGAPLTAAAVWGLFVAPKAAIPVSGRLRLLLQFGVFGAAALALLDTGPQRLALLFAAIVIVNAALIIIWQQDQGGDSVGRSRTR